MANQFPDPSVTTEYIAPNGTEYKYDPIDKKWVPIGFVDPIIPEMNDDNQQPETIDDRYINISGDTLTGDLVVLDPVEDLNCATKIYVDIYNSTIGNHLVHDGDTMKGPLEVPTPIEDGHLSNIEYVDIVVDKLIYKLGDEMTGTLGFEADPTELEPVVYKFSPSIVELKERSGSSVTTTLDLTTDYFYINNFVELKDDGKFTFNSPIQFSDLIISDTCTFNLNNLFEIQRGTEDYITYQGPIEDNKEVITKQYVDDLYAKYTSSVPVGSIFFWVSTQEPPSLYFKLDGSSFDPDIYESLHNYLLGSDGYTKGKLPDYSNRYACHAGSPNDGAPGQKLIDTNSFTGTTDPITMALGSHKHTVAVTGGTHTHTWGLTGGGTHDHTYAAWNDPKSGTGTGGKNPNTYNSAAAMQVSNSHTHTVSIDDGHHTHSITVYNQSDIGTHSHTHTISNGDNTTRPLSFLGYWIIKNK